MVAAIQRTQCVLIIFAFSVFNDSFYKDYANDDYYNDAHNDSADYDVDRSSD